MTLGQLLALAGQENRRAPSGPRMRRVSAVEWAKAVTADG